MLISDLRTTSKRIGLVVGMVCLFLCSTNLRASDDAPQTEQSCTALTSLKLPGVDLKVIEAKAVPAGPFSQGHRGRAVDLPAHCLWRAEINPRTGVDGKHYGIGFELRLPVAWNGKFFFQGGGGMDGLVRPAIGVMPNGGSTAPVALARGYAVASTDAGHEGLDGSFGADQQARIDYYYNAIEQVTEVAQRVLPIYYGSVLKRSYFLGCSNGGRQALIAAQRFPLLFDGVVSGDPAFDLTRAAVAEMWDDATYLKLAPKNGNGVPILSRAFSDADLKLLGDSVLAKCDALDGVKDGSIDRPEACHYDPAVLTCKGAKQADCLSAEQVSALKTAFGGPKNSDGSPLYSDWPYDSGLGTMGWRWWKLGTSETGQSNAANMTLGIEATKSIHMDVYHSTLDVNHFDFDHAAEKMKSVSGMEDATYTAMTSFYGHGGKLILFTGMSDPIFSANDLIRYYRKLEANNDGAAATNQWAKLYLIPGMNHCGGGPALDDFDPLTALDNWVEKGDLTPMTAKGTSFPGRTRAMCAYPEYPHYVGSGSVDDARNFKCERDAHPEK